MHNQKPYRRPYPKPVSVSATASASSEKREIKSFRDMECYREAVVSNRTLVERLLPIASSCRFPAGDDLRDAGIKIPLMVAEGFGMRAYDREKASLCLLSALRACDRVICFSDQLSEVYAKDSDRPACRETLEKYLFVRIKIQGLLKTWRTWDEEKSRPSAAAAGVARISRPSRWANDKT